mmetsp:Transcript_1624/g.4984  ORF Transcript_1624/g.4984 Transcript_1624/m.4984 type:complete len:604 (-) Transcript_1624:72-1883(-)
MARPQRPSEDDSAPLFFLLVLLACAVVPWTLVVLWELLFPGKREAEQAFPRKTEDGLTVRHCQTQAMAAKRASRLEELRSRGRLCTRGFLFRMAILLLLWCWLAYIAVQIRGVMATSALYQNFDPYDILGIGRSTGSSEIKKAFRKMSLKYHPDKNPAASAAERFMLVKKAYDALTDPRAKRNYALYGNPDGPTHMELSVAIPSFGKESQGLVLVLFLLLFVLGVPLTLLWFMSGGGGPELCANGVRRTTMEALQQRATELTDVKKAQDFLLQAGESAACEPRPGEDEALAALAKELSGTSGPKAAKKGNSGPLGPQKAELLFLAHAQRRRELLGASLSADLDELLGRWRRVSLAMADLAARLGLGEPLEAALELHRCVVQALEPRDLSAAGAGPLLQVPHFAADSLKLWRKGPRKSAGLPALLELPSEELRTSLSSLDLGVQEIADVEEFRAVAPRADIVEAKVFVEGEDGICQGDYATLQVKFTRNNLREGEAAGAAHAPHFPGAEVREAWWLRFIMPAGKASRVSRCVRILDPGREVVVRMKFKVLTVGKCRCGISLLCEAYAGVDLAQDLSFESKAAPAERADDESEGEEEGEDSADED